MSTGGSNSNADGRGASGGAPFPADPGKAVITLLREPQKAITAAQLAGQGLVNDMRKTADLFMRTAADLPEVRTLARVSDDLKKNVEKMSRQLGATSAASLHLEDWSVLQERAGTLSHRPGASGGAFWPPGSMGPSTGMKKSSSESDFSRMRRAMVQRQREELLRAEEGLAHDLPSISNPHPNITVVHRMPRFPRVTTSPALPPLQEDDESRREMNELATNLLNAPQRALQTAQQSFKQTTDQIQVRMQQSAESLQQVVRTAATGLGLAPGASRSPDLGPLPRSNPTTTVSAPVSPLLGPQPAPSVSFTSRGSALDMVLPGGARALDHDATNPAEADDRSAASPPLLGDVTLPWSILPGYLRARELAASEHSAAQGDEDTAAAGKRLGPADGAPGERIRHISIGPFQIPLPAPFQRDAFSIRDPGRHLAIVTTAALPWMTGTSVNPLLRAAYLAKDGNRTVTLVVPWLAPVDQRKVYPNQLTFETPEDQEVYIRDWAQNRTGFDSKFRIVFYPGRYAPEKGSILAVGDITQYIADHEADVAVLEEPEHLNWYHHGKRWTDKFKHVVGVVHTNYLDYARREEDGEAKAKFLAAINQWVCRSHCHKVIKLSGAVQPMPREVTEFVHGVSPSFLRVGEAKAQEAAAAASSTSIVVAPEAQRPRSSDPAGPSPSSSSSASSSSSSSSAFKKGVYFIGKVIWAKGYTELLDLMSKHSDASPVHVDVFGSGDDLDAVRADAVQRRLPMTFHGAKDHLDKTIHDYKVFVNPSTSDVVATTTAEALAMGKFVVVPDLPCNHFFSTFSNCLIYKTPEEFSECLQKAISSEPAPMSTEERHRLTWEAATERFLDVAEVDRLCKKGPVAAVVDNVLASAHNTLTGMETVRRGLGAGSNTKHAPQRITDYAPSLEDVGGFFDAHARAKAFHSKDSAPSSAAASSADLAGKFKEAQAAVSAAGTGNGAGPSNGPSN